MNTQALGHRALKTALSRDFGFQVDSGSLGHWAGDTPEHSRVKSENQDCRNSLPRFNVVTVTALVNPPIHQHGTQRSLAMSLCNLASTTVAAK